MIFEATLKPLAVAKTSGDVQTVDYITPHTYIVTEISYFEWASAFVLYQQKGGHS